MIRHTVKDGVPPTPIVRYLKRAYPAMPGWALRNALKGRDVRVNGRKCGAEATVAAGDDIGLYLDARHVLGRLTVLYRDRDLLVVDKPPALPVDVDEAGIGEDTALTRLRAIDPNVRLCHRLDTDTGGVLIAALHDRAHERVLREFGEHRVRKEYACVAVGRPERPSAQLHGHLAKDAPAARVQVFDRSLPGTLPIQTDYRLIHAEDGLSWLIVDLITGRTHQIRAHLAHVGLPLLGDDKYGNRAENRARRVQRPLLWCARMEILGLALTSAPQFPPPYADFFTRPSPAE